MKKSNNSNNNDSDNNPNNNWSKTNNSNNNDNDYNHNNNKIYYIKWNACQQPRGKYQFNYLLYMYTYSTNLFKFNNRWVLRCFSQHSLKGLSQNYIYSLFQYQLIITSSSAFHDLNIIYLFIYLLKWRINGERNWSIIQNYLPHH